MASMTVVVWYVTNTGAPYVRASMLRVAAQVGAVAVVHPVVVAEPLGPHLLALEVERRVLLVPVFVHLSAKHEDKTGWCNVSCPSLHVAHIRIVRPLHNEATGEEGVIPPGHLDIPEYVHGQATVLLNLCLVFSVDI